MPTPQVLLGAEARAQLKNGLDLLAQVISLTLGPRAGGVALSRIAKGPEVLTSSAVIARRIVEIPCRGANVGAMLLRNALCRVNDQLGDGGATTAALAVRASLERTDMGHPLVSVGTPVVHRLIVSKVCLGLE